MVGFVSGYLVPSRPTTLFIWQVAVSESARGTGLATRMLLALLEREACKDVWQIETTITASNTASQALFERLAATLTAPVAILEGYDKENHFDGIHETEHLWRIGPIPKIQTRLLI